MKICDLIDCSYDIEITGISDDSRKVEKGYLFVATHGYNSDHYDFISDAINRGCSFVICDREINYDFPHLVVDNINELFYSLCRKFYNLDLSYFNFIGITGTDGKTTCATLISRIIDDCAYIGTNGLYLGDEEYPTSNTTPCVSELYKDLAFIRDKGYRNVVMEVSSEALLYDRVSEIRFSIACFTNITGDHLNVHKTFENYVKAKMKLIDLVKDDGVIIVNGDDPILSKIQDGRVHRFGFNDVEYKITSVLYNKRSSIITLNDKVIINSPFIGKYNVYNVVMSYIVGIYYGIPSSLVLDRIKNTSYIKGRGEFLDYNTNYDIVLDYAHTINGIKNVINTFRDKYNFITVVTGCAGGRDKSKRSIIGHFIMSICDRAIFTMDDPRNENVDDIIDDMVGNNNNYIRITDRVNAIHYALDNAPRDSVVLILGKGRDNYMAIGDKKEKYCDYDVIRDYFKKK